MHRPSGAVEGVEVVYHIAATYREAGSPTPYRAINVEARGIPRSGEGRGVTRAVHCSTGGVHGHIENPRQRERAIQPGDVYQETKPLPSNSPGDGASTGLMSWWPAQSESMGRATHASCGCPGIARAAR